MLTFKTTLQKMPHADIDLSPRSAEKSDQFKKRCRVTLSVQKTSTLLGFLHACLLDTPSGAILIAGKSGSGKSTLAQKIVQQTPEVKIIANDWVAVEKEGKDYFASDLNYADSLRHPGRCKVTGIIFLSEHDTRQRDAFFPTKIELKDILLQTLDAMSLNEARILSKFWLHNYTTLPFVSVVPNASNSIKQSLRIITDILWRYKTFPLVRPKLQIGIMGTGAVGSMLAYQLGHMDHVKAINLYDRTLEKARGITLDLNHSAGIDVFCNYNAAASLKSLLKKTHIVFITFRDSTSQGQQSPPDTPERMVKLYTHLKTIDSIAKAASDCSFRGTFFVVTNPSDILSYALWKKSQKYSHPLKTYQVFGLGMELDKARALYYHRIHSSHVNPESLAVYGNHMANVTVLYESRVVKGVIASKVKNASEQVRILKSVRTVYGPTKAFVRNTEALIRGGPTTLTTVEKNCFIGGEISFSGGMPSKFVHKQTKTIFKEHKQYLAKYEELI